MGQELVPAHGVIADYAGDQAERITLMPVARSHLSLQSSWLVFLDFICITAGGLIGSFWRFGQEEIGEYVFDHFDGFLIFAGSLVLANYLAGSYRVQITFSRFNLVVTWIFSLLFAILVLSITSYAWFRLLLGRGVLFLSIMWYSIFSLLFRQFFYRSFFRSSMFLCRTVVVGGWEMIAPVRRAIEKDWILPAHRIVACLEISESADVLHPQETMVKEGVPLIRVTKESLVEMIKGLDARLVVIADDLRDRLFHLFPEFRRMRFEGIEILNKIVLSEIYEGRTPVEMIDENFLVNASLESGMPGVSRLKRVLDVVAALAGIALFFVPALVIALVIKLSKVSAPVFYSQQRLGQFGYVFRIYKFRTMCEDAEDETGPVWAEPDDPRITRLGRILRKYRLDEIPQLWNVLKGEMSIVGPRPERPELSEKLSREIPFYNERTNALPGLTGWAQTKYPYGNSIEDARKKLEYDLFYIKNVSFSLDLQIILSTLRIMLFGKERAS